MSKNRPEIEGYLVEHVERGKPMYIVGAKDRADPRYEGPRAQITWDGDWLNIVTCKYEGNVMLNIEALEPLRKALAKVSRTLKSKAA